MAELTQYVISAYRWVDCNSLRSLTMYYIQLHALGALQKETTTASHWVGWWLGPWLFEHSSERKMPALSGNRTLILQPLALPALETTRLKRHTHTNTFTNGRVLILLRHNTTVSTSTIGIRTHGLSSSLRYTVVTMRLRSDGQISGLQIHQTSGNVHETQIQTAAAIPCYWPKTTICVVLLTSHVWRTEHKTQRYAVKGDELQRAWKEAFPTYCSTIKI